MRTRLLLIIPTMDCGGAEKQLALLARSLPKTEFEVHVCLLTRDGPRSQELRDAGIPVTVIGKRFKADPSALFRLKRFIVEFSPDIVHTWIFAANSFGRAAALLAKVPVILGSERCVDPWKRWWHFAIDRYLAGRCSAITTNSNGVRDFYVSHGIAADRFRVIANGIAPLDSKPISRDEAYSRLGVAPSRKLILAVGRLWPQKRYRDLIWAGELLAVTRGDATLIVIGDGPQKAELLRFRDAVSTPQHVALGGPREDVLQVLPHADCFWLGSEYEGQSNALIEAMQSGVPVVVSDIAGNRDLVQHDQTGRLFPLGDRAALVRETIDLLEDPSQRERLAGAARKRITEQFSVELMVQRHIAVYREFLRHASA